VKASLECPVAKVEFVSPREIKKLRTDQTETPALIDLEFSLNEAKCMLLSGEPARYMPKGQLPDYPFLRRRNVGCYGVPTDPAASLLTTTNEKTLYNENQIYEQLKEANPMYEFWVESAGNRLGLYSYHLFGFLQVILPSSVEVPRGHYSAAAERGR